MSDDCGVCCDLSAVLTHKRANKPAVKCPAKDLLSGFKGPTVESTFKHSMACNSELEFGMEKEVNKGDNGGYDFKSAWSLDWTKQANGLTIQLGTNGAGEWNSMVDWGQVYPNLSLFSAWKWQDKCFTLTKGLVYSQPTWGVVAELQKNEKKERLYQEKFWYKKGALQVGTRVDVNLQTYRFQKYDALLSYKINENLGLCVGHCSENEDQGFHCGKLCLSTKYTCPADQGAVALGVCKGKDGVKWSVGAECKSGPCPGTFTLNNCLTLGMKRCCSWGDKVKCETWVNLPMRKVVGCQIRGLGDFEKCVGWGTKFEVED